MAIDKLKAKQLKLDAALNTASIKQQMRQIPGVKVKADAEINGAQQIDDLRQKMETQDAASVVGKLAALDSKAAVTANDLAVAMSQTASSANIGGVSMDRLLGYLATVQEATQRSAETIGQSMKTIFPELATSSWVIF